MPGFQRQRLWDEKPLSDSIKASFLTKPDERMIVSSTSNVQLEPCCIVLIDHKFPLIGVTSVTVRRSRRNESNTASISLVNIGSRYSGPNKTKIAANVPVSIYMGYSKRYLQRFEGFIDTTSMTVNETSCNITIECRDKAKPWIENKDISCGIYAPDSDYFGVDDWHFALKTNGGVTEPVSRPWSHEEVIRDVCYVLGLRDIVPYISIEAKDMGNGFTDYVRHVNYGAEYKITIDPKWESPIKCNFVEENALDVLSKLAQSVFHEVLFDQQGKLVVRPVKSATDDAVFYYKEERDIIELSQSTNDDDVANIITVIGQTADETAVIYPWCMVAQSDNIKLEKGQDQYGYQVKYPKVVAQENIGSLTHASLYAHTLYPNRAPVSADRPQDNPENNPIYDFVVHYPNFAQPYEKQICLEASCPIITDEAIMSNSNNIRTWNFYGEVDTAVAYENQPIMLKDRFNKDILVVCKERSMDDDSIEKCGGKVFDVGNSATTDGEIPVNIPTVFDNYKFIGGFNYQYEHKEDVPAGTPSYAGSSPTSGTYVLSGSRLYKDSNGQNKLPSSASGSIPAGLTASSFDNKLFTVSQFTVIKGNSPYYPQIDHSVFDMASISTVVEAGAIILVDKVVDVFKYVVGGRTYYALSSATGGFINATMDFTNPRVMSGFDYSVATTQGYIGCILHQDPQLGGTIQLGGSYMGSSYTMYKDLPAGAGSGTFSHQWKITYPLFYSALGSGLSGGAHWGLRVFDQDLVNLLRAVIDSEGRMSNVYIATIDRKYVANSDPDTNCIYWRWFGTFKKDPTENNSSDRNCPTKQDMSKQGKDAEGNPRKLITKAQFHKLAAEPHTVVIECTTAGIDHKSWAEVLELSENQLVVKGHNLYGSMADEYREMLENIDHAIDLIGGALVALGLAIAFHSHEVMAGDPPGPGTAFPCGDFSWESAVGLVIAFVGGILIFKDMDKNVGQNVSRVMEDLKGRVTACRRPEIELHGAGWSQAAQWYARELDSSKSTNPLGKRTSNYTYMRYTPMSMFGYSNSCSVEDQYKDSYRTPQSGSLSRDWCWVYILDLTSGSGYAEGAMLTAFGWETPEVGDRNPLPYYTGVDYHQYVAGVDPTATPNRTHKIIKTRYAIEAFADDDLNSNYTAERLLALRFENKTGVKPSPTETWWNSRGYEILVDRSMNEVAITDAGVWHDFGELRESLNVGVERRYKYVALIVYEWDTQEVPMNISEVASTAVHHITFGSSPSETVFAPTRWGLFVPRGLNLGWYNKFRYLEKSLEGSTAEKHEQNYLTTQIVSQGQELLIANLYNNFKYSSVQATIRIWGKPYGTYAPTLVYYKESDALSMNTYGDRQIEIQNNLINDFKTARRLANMLTAQSNETFTMQTTGKPYIYEGDVVMVKEENSGAIAGVFRDWENSWKDPEMKDCSEVANQLVVKALPGVYQPQYATPTYENKVMVACSNGTKPTYLVELDAYSNPVWYSRATSTNRPVFIICYGSQDSKKKPPYVIVGTADGTIQKLDYNIAKVVGTIVLPASPLCATMDEEQKIMFVGTASRVYAVNVETFSLLSFPTNIGGARGIAAANNLAYSPLSEDKEYREMGVLFTASTSGIRCWRIYRDQNRSDFGPVITSLPASNSFGVPFTNPGTLEFDKHTGELIYVNKSNSSRAASIWGIHVDVEFDPDKPELGITAEFDELRWKIDYMEDVELKQSLPNATARKLYIDKFFKPVHAIYDINKSLLICDSDNNRVYKLNPSGKFYVTEVTDQFDISDDAATYKQTYSMVTVTAAASLQLTNFGRNFINSKTREEIEAKASTTMGRIIEVKPREKFMVKLLSSETVVEAINNTGVPLSVKDTVIVMMGLGGDTSGVGTIIAKKALNDWTIETGKPYTYVDATSYSLDITKYGVVAKESSGSGGGTSSTDLSAYNSRLRTIENKIKTLASIHGLNW